MTQTKYVRYIETSEANFHALQEMYRGTEMVVRETKQRDAVRIEGPVSRKPEIDAIVEKYDVSVGW